jgi:hypothetical protein
MKKPLNKFLAFLLLSITANCFAMQGYQTNESEELNLHYDTQNIYQPSSRLKLIKKVDSILGDVDENKPIIALVSFSKNDRELGSIKLKSRDDIKGFFKSIGSINVYKKQGEEAALKNCYCIAATTTCTILLYSAGAIVSKIIFSFVFNKKFISLRSLASFIVFSEIIDIPLVICCLCLGCCCAPKLRRLYEIEDFSESVKKLLAEFKTE